MRPLVLAAALLGGGCATVGTPHQGRQTIPICSFMAVDGIACTQRASPEPDQHLSWLNLQYLENTVEADHDRHCAVDPRTCANNAHAGDKSPLGAARGHDRSPPDPKRGAVKLAEAP